MTLREKRRRDLTNTLDRTIAQRDGCLANLVRYEAKLKTLRRQLQRLDRAITIETKAPAPKPPAIKGVQPSPPETVDEPAIPLFLQRKAGDDKDEAARAEIEATQASHRAAKARGRSETRKAKARGDLTRMPLTGRAAIEAIRKA